jgi:hypothetical protein
MRLVSGDPKTIVSTIPGGYAIRYVPDEKIHAKITGSFTIGAITFYTWSEVRALISGAGYEVVTGGRTGTSTAAYASEINGSSSVATDTIVVLYKRIIADTTSLGAGGSVVAMYEFAVGGGGGGAVSSVQCVGNILYVTYG